MIKTSTISGIAKALTPIVHSEILSWTESQKNKTDSDKGKPKATRTMPFLIQALDETTKTLLPDTVLTKKDIPVVSGNGIRGLERRLIADFSFNALGYTIGDIFPDASEAKKVHQFIYGGGLSPKGQSPVAVAAGTYAKMQDAIPFLSLLGGVYEGHHFEGSCKIGIFIPITQETYHLCKEILPPNLCNPISLPSILDFEMKTDEAIRYTRRAESEPTEEKSPDPEAMIYGIQVIPAGTSFATYNTCTSSNEGAILAFNAMFALLADYGYVGGMSGRGHGQMVYTMHCANGEVLNPESAMQAYADHLLAHKEEIKNAIKSIPANFKTGESSKKTPDKKPKKDKKTDESETATESEE